MKMKKLPMPLVVSALVIGFGSVVLAPPASADGCIVASPVGYTVSCAGSGGSYSGSTAPQITGNGNPFGSVGGLNCTANNYHTCRALQETGNAP